MGIVNVTPDSFYSGSRVSNEKTLLDRIENMVIAGTDFIDIGGYSSRPGADQVPIHIEEERIAWSVQTVRKHFPQCILSLDTFRSSVARIGLEEGIDLINDISAGQLDSALPELVAQYKVPYLIMHMRGTPQTMQKDTSYTDIVSEINRYFSERIQTFRSMGIQDLLLDPGIGFSKTVEQNFQLIKNAEMFHLLNCPVLFGISRKSFIQKKLGVSVENSLTATNVLHGELVKKGIQILRTHDVTETKQTVDILRELL